MVHGREHKGSLGQGAASRSRYHGLGGPEQKAAPQKNAAAQPNDAGLLDIIKGIFSKYTRTELEEAAKAEKAYCRYAQKLSEKYHVHMKESRLAKLRAAHRARSISEEQYHKELKLLMKTRPGDLDILEEISFA